MSFEELKLIPEITRATHDLGYDEPTPVQEQSIPLILEGHDVLVGAQTGTGKTAGFALPILQLLSQKPAAGRAIRALVLTPTRELAAQIDESFHAYGKYLDLKSLVIFGGVSQGPQVRRLKAGCDILVATPGRLLDLQEQGELDLSRVEYLVLDEADRMLDMGFIHDVKKVLALVSQDKQSLLFSATFTDDIRELAAGLLKNPKNVQVTPPNTTVELIQQYIYPVGRDRKSDALLHLIVDKDWQQVLIFTRTKFTANQVADFLNEHGVKAMALHGNKSQARRTQALDGFKDGKLRALVATDIAARGIDIDELPEVVNFDIPNVPEDYVHRIGRTGRAGSDGEAASLVCMDEEGFMHAIEKFTRQRIPVRILEQFGPTPDEKAEPIAMGRQTLWGGLGKPPSREEMKEAARKARREMSERRRQRQPARGRQKDAPNRQDRGHAEAERQQQGQSPAPEAENGEHDKGSPRRDGRGLRGLRSRRRRRSRQGRPNGADQETVAQGSHPDRGHHRSADHGADVSPSGGDRLPTGIDPLQINLHRDGGRPKPARKTIDGQPNPLQTSVDNMRRGRGVGGGGGNEGGGRRRRRSGRHNK